MIPSLLMPVRSPSFQLFFADLGAGQVSLTETMQGATATFTRATAAWTRLSTGLWASVSSGVARSYYDINGGYRGWIREPLATADGTFPRDLTNAAWNTKTTVTVAKDQVGIDGVANSASSVLATGANSVITQAVTLTSRALTFQPFVKRLTGTGTILISLDGFATTTDITSLISTGAWTDLGVVFKTQTLANPAFGFKIVTSGDKIAVDMADLIEGSVTGTPVNGTTRNAESLVYTTSPSVNSNSLVVTATPLAIANLMALVSISDGSVNNQACIFSDASTGASHWQVNSGGVAQANVIVGSNVAGTRGKYGGTFQANDANGYFNGVTGTQDTSVTVPVSFTRVTLGTDGAGSFGASVAIEKVGIYPPRLPDGVMDQLTT